MAYSQETGIEELIRLVKAGNTDAFRHVIENYRLPLYRYVYHMLQSREEAEDAVQDVFLQVLKNVEKYSLHISFTAWLYKIAYRHCLNLIRKRNGLISRLHLFHRPAVTPDYDSKLRVNELLRELTLEEKQIVLLRVVEEMTFEEISEILECKPATVRKRFERTRNKLKRKYVIEEVKNVEQGTWSSIAPER
ncbi:RNA polymerase sigma factor [Paenibacillus silvisoli]|uniref:RNA polymerase sigma factor n=1 Tax=Paenibacillus silvisoli TaxID=3110539 RepID=UPI002804458A|nr:RNA polymerase sigma factor [Paenibacillus silvisoli]